METESVNTTNWRSNILIVLVVLASILLALILAQLDSLNELIQPLPTAVADSPGSGSGNGDPEPGVPTPLPTSTSTPIPTNTATPEADDSTPTSTPTVTAVPVLPQCGSIPSGWIPYAVKPGDTLYSLSIRSGASMEAITQANCLQMGKLIAGTVIYLPPTPPVLLPCGVPPQWVAYIVQPGDTLYSLAVRTGTTVYKIMRANCLTSSRIYAGQKLYVPGYPAATATATKTPTATSTVPGIPATATATATATVTGTVVPTVTSTVTTTVFPTTTVLAPPTATVLPPPTSTTLPTAYPPAPSPTTPPLPTAYP